MGAWRVRRLGRLAALLLCLAAAGDGAAARDVPAKVEVLGTAFRLTMTDGRVLAGADLVGAGGPRLRVRIDAVRPDPRDPAGRHDRQDVALALMRLVVTGRVEQTGSRYALAAGRDGPPEAA